MKKTAKRSISGRRRSSQKRAASDNTRTGKPQNQKPATTLLPDSSTDALKTLSKMRFLADEPSFLDQRVQVSKDQEKTSKLAAQYSMKQQAMKDNIQKQLSAGGRIVNMEIPGRFGPTDKKEVEGQRKKLADGFVRSERNQAMRVRDTIELEIEDLKNGKDDLIKNLNKKMLKLDELNSQKKIMHEKLAEQMQFIRDLQKALGGASVGDLNSLVATEVREAYQQEKALHQQLEEQLLNADAERSNLVERIQMLSGEKKEIIVIQNGQKKSFKVTSQNIESLALQIKQFQGQIMHQEQAINFANEDRVKLSLELQALQRQLNHLNHEKNMLLQKTREIECKSDHAVACLGSETARSNQIHQAHSKLLSIRLLESLLSAQVQASQQRAFQQIWKVQKDERTVYLIQVALKKVSITAHIRKLRTAIMLWFQNAMAPIKVLRQDDGLVQLMQNVDRTTIEISMWTIDDDLQYILNESKYKGLMLLTNTVQKIKSRFGSWSLQTWKKATHLKCYAPSKSLKVEKNIRFVLQKVRRCIQKYHQYTLTQRFHQWRTETAEQLNQFRLLALAKSLAVQQMSCRLFTAWKVRTLQIKLKKRSLLVRAFKNLKTNLRRIDSFGANKTLISQMQGEAGLSIVEACFDKLIYYTRQKQLKRSQAQNLTISPQISELKSKIKNLQERMDNSQKVRAINCLVVAPILKRVQQYFGHWRTTANKRARDVKLDIKYLVIKTYKRKLMVAFNRFRTSLTWQSRNSRHGNIDSVHDQNYNMEHERLQLTRKILINADIVRQQGLKQFRELCCKATQKNGSYWMQQWHQAAQFKSSQLSAAQLILNKMRNRILRTALTNFKRGFNFYLQDQYNFRRAHEVKRRLVFRIKKRVFNAIANFTNQHNNQILALRYLVKTCNRHLLVRGMLNWQNFSLNTKEANLLKLEKEQVIIIDDLQNQLSCISDVKNESDITNQRFKSALMTGASQTLKKWVIRSHLGGQQYGFITWKQKTSKLRHRQVFVKFISRSIDANMSKTVWFRWKQTLALDNRKNLESSIKHKVVQIDCQEQQINFNRLTAERELIQIGHSTASVNSEAVVYSKKAAKALTELIDRRQVNVVFSRTRFMFQHWRLYSRNQYRCVVALEKGISKMCLQRAFIEIRNSYKEDFRNQVLSAHLSNIFRLKLLLPARQAINKWKTHIYSQIQIEISETNKETVQETQRQAQRVVQIRHVQIQLISNRKNETLKIASFMLWKKFLKFSKLQKNQIRKVIDVERTFQIRQAIHRMRQRASLTAKFNSKFQLLKKKRDQIYMQACFVKAWKYIYVVDKRIVNGARRIENSLVFSKCLLAFQRIQTHAKIRYEASCRNREQAVRLLVKRIERMRAIRLSDACRMIKLTTHFNATMFFKLKQCLNNRSSINARSYFDQWRQNCLKQGVADFNNHEDGPVNIECWNERHNCQNLVRMMQEDGNSDAQVQLFLRRQSDKFYELGEKTVCRMMVCQDRNLKLIPIALDRLRNYSRIRKVWRQKLEFVNGLVEFDRHNIFLRFQRWKNFDSRMRDKLKCQPLKELQTQEDANKRRLIDLSDQVNSNTNAVDEFKDQKGVLFRCFIGAQKLALSASKANYERAQQKALIRFSDFGNSKLQSEIGSAVQRNLDLIQQLKKRISRIEHENHLIASQNDEFRYDAVKAVHEAHQVDILRGDNERLQYEVANSAQTVKNLMSDNQLLARHLQEHRVEAKIQLEHTQSLQNQKLAELEQLKAAERLSSASRRGSSLRTQQKQSLNREPTRSLSPIIQDHSITGSNKSPLRLRNLHAQTNI